MAQKASARMWRPLRAESNNGSRHVASRGPQRTSMVAATLIVWTTLGAGRECHKDTVTQSRSASLR